MTTQPNKLQEAGACICAGLFIVVSGDKAAAHILTSEDVSHFYEGTRFARDSRDPETAMTNLVQRTFRSKEASFAIPAHDKAQLVTIMDSYNGPASVYVRGIAAAWLLGPFTPRDGSDGAHDRMPDPPVPPPAPADTQSPQEAPESQPVPSADGLTFDALKALLATAR